MGDEITQVKVSISFEEFFDVAKVRIVTPHLQLFFVSWSAIVSINHMFMSGLLVTGEREKVVHIL